MAGTAEACDKESLQSEIEWMLKHDYDEATVINFDLMLTDPEWQWVEDDVTVQFMEGPVPSYIDSDDEPPWETGPYVPHGVDFHADVGKVYLPYDKYVADDLSRNIPQEKE